jgi:hypothetical protein
LNRQYDSNSYHRPVSHSVAGRITNGTCL